MPMREYQCRVCRNIWEELRKDQTDPQRCPNCKCDTVDRKLAAGSFQFAKGGFSSSSSKGSQKGI